MMNGELTGITANTSPLLVVDDEPDLRTLYELTLLREGYEVDVVGSLAEARERLATTHYGVVITDMRLPDGLGLDLVRQITQDGRGEKSVVITAYGSAENAVQALKSGAFDYLTKPVDLKQFRRVIASAMTRGPSLAPTLGAAGENLIQPSRMLLGSSATMQQVRNVVAKVAATMAPVLVQGESGTGKELVARSVHQGGHRAAGPFVAVNCGAIPEALMEAEFFGYRKGAFTGASEDRAGLFVSAAGGTLFLDEIGELPLPMQAKLLRAIQERAVRPVGATAEESVDVRIVSATHRCLSEEVKAGRFRQDLYYRLNVIEIDVPPLRARHEDIQEIAHALLVRICQDAGIREERQLAEDGLAALMGYGFPGNVRELENILQRAVALASGPVLHARDLMLPEGASLSRAGTSETAANQAAGVLLPLVGARDEQPLPSDLGAHLDAVERDILVRALQKHDFNRTAAAAQLGLTLRQIRYRMERLRIDVPGDGEGA